MSEPKERGIIFQGDMVQAIQANRKRMTRRVIKPQPISTEHCRKLTGSSYHLYNPTAQAGNWRIAGPVGVVCQESGLRNGYYWKCPYGVPGDLLIVRETWQEYSLYGGKKTCFYRADGEHQLMGTRFCYDATYHDFTDGIGEGSTFESQNKWHPSIHIPKWAARIWLRITGVRVEQVQEISRQDAFAEGIKTGLNGLEQACGRSFGNSQLAFRHLWNSINAKPKPVYDGKKNISHYTSYPWEDIRETREHRGKPWIVCGNPYNFVVEFERIEQ